MNNQNKAEELKRIIAIAQDDLALLMKKSKRFEPEIGQEYCFVKDNGQVDRNPWDNDIFDLGLWDIFNCYETEDLASKAAVMMKRNNAIINACLMVDPNFVPDYLSGNKVHYSLGYQNGEVSVHPKWFMTRAYTCNYGPCVSTQEKWEEAAALLKEWEVE
jgi:hypothetical protein